MDKIYRCIFVYIRQTNLNKYSYKLIPTVWLCMSVNTPMLTVAKLKEGGYGGVTHPPQLPISQGTEEVCRAKVWNLNY